MREQRRHQRVRFAKLPSVRLGQSGLAGSGELENLSLGGLMLRTALPLKVGEAFGCEFVVFDSPLIDMSALVVSRVGDLYGVRFQAGPISACLIEEAIGQALAAGRGSILSINDLHGRKVMRIAGGLNGALHNDFMHGLTRMGVDEMDLAAVTAIDSAGLELCRVAVDRHQVGIVHASSCVRTVLAGQTSLLVDKR
jgi:hypothetical protein